MQRITRRSLGLLAALSVAACLFLYACGSTGRVKVGTKPAPGTELEFELEFGKDGTFRGNSTWVGWCFEIKWKDEDKKEIGTSSGAVGGNGMFSGAVPAGSAWYCAKFFECPPPTRSTTPTPTLALASGDVTYVIVDAPVVPGFGAFQSNLSTTLAVTAPNGQIAQSIADAVRTNGIGAPLPASVQVLRWYDAMLVGDGRVRIDVAMPGAFTQCDIVVNGKYTAGLSDGVTILTSGGWEAATARVPLSAFNLGHPGSNYATTNLGEVTFMTNLMAASDTIGCELTVSN